MKKLTRRVGDISSRTAPWIAQIGRRVRPDGDHFRQVELKQKSLNVGHGEIHVMRQFNRHGAGMSRPYLTV